MRAGASELPTTPVVEFPPSCPSALFHPVFALFLYQIVPVNPTHPLPRSRSFSLLHSPSHRTLPGFYSLIRFVSRCRFISPSFFLNFFFSTIYHIAFCSPFVFLTHPFLLRLPLPARPVSHSLVLILLHGHSFSFVSYRTISFTYAVQFPVHGRLARIFHISFKLPSLSTTLSTLCERNSKRRKRQRGSETSFFSRFPSYQCSVTA